MRKRCYLVLSVTLLCFIVGKTYSQESVTAKAFAKIVESMSVNEDEALNFGSFSPGSTESTVVISPDGMRSVSGTAVAVRGDYCAGSFTLYGAVDASFAIKLPEGSAILTHEKSGNTMQVKSWVSTPSAETAMTLSDGSCIVNIGATLEVGTLKENPVGLYSGTYTLTFAYN